MKKIIIFTGLMLLPLLFTTCKDDLENTTFNAYTEQPIGIYLEMHPEYSEWVKLLKKANLYNALNIKTKFTCFVVSNASVAEYLKAKGYASVDDIPVEEVIYLMKYHIIPGVAYVHAAFSGMIRDTTASGDYLTVTYHEGGINAMYVNDYARIEKKDITVINGYIHILDKVLNPVIETVWDIIKASDRYTIFREALEACQLEEYLDSRYRKLTSGTSVKDYKTVFVISDEIFQANGIHSLTELRARFSGAADDEKSEFRKFMKYHIINRNSDFAELATFDAAATTKKKNVAALALNSLIAFSDTKGELLINPDAQDTVVRLVKDKFDLQGNNGFVHEVDNLMTINNPVPSLFEFEFTDVDQCRILPLYRSWTSTLDQYTYVIDREENTGTIRWQTIPDNPVAIKYQLRSQSWAKNNDLLYITLGYTGWVEIDIPIIAAGKYTVTLYKFAYSARGTLQMYLDGMKFGPLLDYTGSGSTAQAMGTITFTESSSHTIRFSAIKPGVCETDRIVFTPVQ